MKHVKPWQICAATVVTLVAFAPGASATSADPVDDYANQTPYGTPEASVHAPPAGYSMFFLESVGRHGARSLTSDGTEKSVLGLWARAAAQNALTERGQTFARDVKLFQKAEEQIGYGKLSGLGHEEWQGIGQRDAETYAPFFAEVTKSQAKIATVTTDVTRTKQSAEALREGLDQAESGHLGLDQVLEPITTNDGLLRFGNRTSEAGQAMTDEIRSRDAIRGYAVDLLRNLYTPAFVDGIKDPVGAALDVYQLYSTAPGMAKETDITFGRYVPQADREPLSYATDAETFYQYGPGVAGETNSYDKARPLLADFFKALDNRVAGSKTAAVFRFGHGETIMPFAALIKAPGSETQTPAGEHFIRQTNPWRGAVAGRLAGNVEWSAFRNDQGNVLVTMRYNEKPVPFNASCKPSSDGSLFYTVTELKRCLS